MGRKARYCCFHSLEGSGAQHRNNIICGVLLEDCVRDEELADKVHLLCPSFLNYSTSTPSQTRELKEIQERATRLGRRHEFTIRKLYHIHEQSGWQWTNANNKIRDALNAIERSVGSNNQVQYASSVAAEPHQQHEEEEQHQEAQQMNQQTQQQTQQQQPVKKQRVQKKKQAKEQQKAEESAPKAHHHQQHNDSPATPASSTSQSSYEDIQMKEILSELVKEPAAPEEVLDFWSSTILPVPQALSTSSSNLLSTSSSNLLASAHNNHHALGHSIIASRVPSFPHPLSRAPVSRSNSNTSLLDACKTDFLNGNNFLFSLGRTN